MTYPAPKVRFAVGLFCVAFALTACSETASKPNNASASNASNTSNTSNAEQAECPAELPEIELPLGTPAWASAFGPVTEADEDQLTFTNEEGDAVVFRAPGVGFADYVDIGEMVSAYNTVEVDGTYLSGIQVLAGGGILMEFGVVAGAELPEPASISLSEYRVTATLSDTLDEIACTENSCDQATSQLTTYSVKISDFNDGEVDVLEPGEELVRDDFPVEATRTVSVHAADTVSILQLDPATCSGPLVKRTRLVFSVAQLKAR